MLAIKVFGLPRLQEPEYKRLHTDLVAATMSIESFGVKDELDMMVWFPPDLMTYGLGYDLWVELTEAGRPQPAEIQHRLYVLMVEALRKAVPKVINIAFVAGCDRSYIWAAPAVHSGGTTETL